MRVRELMSTELTTVDEATSLKEAAQLMTAQGVSGLPVVDESGRLVGIISEADFVAHTSSRGRAGLLRALFDDLRSRSFDQKVGEAMSRKLVTVTPYDSHREAARLMTRHRIKRLPVVDADGRLEGIISRSDLLRVFTRSDSEIVEAIRNRVARQILAIDDSDLEVEVTDGHVKLAGTVTHKSEARMLEELVGDLAGVISVEANVGYRVDDTLPSAESAPYGVPRRNW